MGILYSNNSTLSCQNPHPPFESDSFRRSGVFGLHTINKKNVLLSIRTLGRGVNLRNWFSTVKLGYWQGKDGTGAHSTADYDKGMNKVEEPTRVVKYPRVSNKEVSIFPPFPFPWGSGGGNHSWIPLRAVTRRKVADTEEGCLPGVKRPLKEDS